MNTLAVFAFFLRNFQTNDVFESSKDVARIQTPEPHAESNVERVSETSERDVALLNSDQTLVSTKEKSTKDKVSSTYAHTHIPAIKYLYTHVCLYETIERAAI